MPKVKGPAAPTPPSDPRRTPEPTAPEAQEPRPKEPADSFEPSLGAPGSLSTNARGAQEDLVTFTALVSAPSTLGKPSPALEASLWGGAITSDGPSGSLGRTVSGEPGQRREALTADVTSAILTVGGARTDERREDSAAIAVTKGYVDLSVSSHVATESGARLSSGFVAASSGTLYAGGSLRTVSGGPTVRAGGFVAVSADRQVADLGAYRGDREELQGTRKVELRRSLGGGLVGSPGVAAAILGIGGRLTVDRSREVVFRTHVPPEEVRALLQDSQGVKGFLRGKARALGLAEETLPPPDLSRPEALRVGDEVAVSVRGSYTAGLALGAFGLAAGVAGQVKGELELSARKLSETKVELSVTPTDVRGLRLSLSTATPLELAHGRVRAEALRQSFAFDLAQPEAAAAYRAALGGKLPNGLAAEADGAPAKADDLLQLLRREKLPAGVERTHLEKLEISGTSLEGGLSWGPVSTLSGVAGLSATSARTEEEGVIAAQGAALAVSSRGVERRREVLLSGTETAGVLASVRHHYQLDERGETRGGFGDLALRAHFTDDKVRGLELNREVVDQLNRAFGLRVPPFERKGTKQGREVWVELTMNAAALERLARRSSAEVAKVAEATGLSARRLEELLRSLRAGQDPTDRAVAVQRLVAEEGLFAMGAVHRLLGDEAGPLVVQTTSTAYEKPVAEAEKLSLLYPEPIRADAPLEETTRRFKAVTKQLDAVEKAWDELGDDGLIPTKKRGEVASSLYDAGNKLRSIVSVRHLAPSERKDLHDRLDAGWTTSTERRFMDHLAAAGLG